MAYYFMVESKRGTYLPLDIKKSIYFQLIKTKYQKPNAYTLNEIDSFTMMFNNELELRKTLIAEGLLPIELCNKPLSTRYLIKGEYEKVRHDFLYQKDLEYMANPTKVTEYIMNKYYQNDFVFIQKLANNFMKYHECSSTAPEVLQAATISIREGKRHHLFEEVDKNGDLLLARLTKLLILKYHENYDGVINYQNEVNYRNLHAVVAFISNYEQKQEPIIEQMTIKEFEQNPKKQEPSTETKTRKKVITPLEGQLSFQI